MKKIPLNVVSFYANAWRRVTVLVDKDGGYRVEVPAADRENCELLGYYPELGRTLSLRLDSGLALPRPHLTHIGVLDHAVGDLLDFDPMTTAVVMDPGPDPRPTGPWTEGLDDDDDEEAEETEETAETTEPADEPDIASDPNLRVVPEIHGRDRHCNMELRTALPSLHGEELESAVAKLPDVFLELYPKSYVRVKFDPSKAPGSYPELIFKFASCPSEERIRVRMLERAPFRRAFCRLVTQICEHLHAGFDRKAKYLCIALRDDVYGEGNKEEGNK